MYAKIAPLFARGAERHAVQRARRAGRDDRRGGGAQEIPSGGAHSRILSWHEVRAGPSASGTGWRPYDRSRTGGEATRDHVVAAAAVHEERQERRERQEAEAVMGDRRDR